MSNLSDYVSIFDENAKVDRSALASFGSFLGVAADISGAFGAVSIVVGFIEQLLASNDTGTKALGTFLTNLDNDVKKLIGSERVDHWTTRLNQMDMFISEAESSFKGLKGELKAGVSTDFRFGEINKCRGKVEGLNTDTQFGANIFDELYYQEPWTGTVAPREGTNDFVGDGLAFSTKYILAEFLRALGYFTTVGTTFDTDFVNNNRDDLQNFLNRLDLVYTKSVQNIVTIRPPSQDELLGPSVQDPDTLQQVYLAFGGFCEGPWARAGNAIPESIEPNPEFYQMYGAVDRFAKFFAVGNYPGVLLPEPNIDPPPSDFFSRFAAELAIQTLNAWKTVFLGLALDNLRESIDQLRKLLGQSPRAAFEPPTGSWWSIRETHDALGDVFPDPNPTPPLVQTTASETIGRLARLGELSTDRPLSWRAALRAVLIPITLQGPPPLPPPQDG